MGGSSYLGWLVHGRTSGHHAWLSHSPSHFPQCAFFVPLHGVHVGCDVRPLPFIVMVRSSEPCAEFGWRGWRYIHVPWVDMLPRNNKVSKGPIPQPCFEHTQSWVRVCKCSWFISCEASSAPVTSCLSSRYSPRVRYRDLHSFACYRLNT